MLTCMKRSGTHEKSTHHFHRASENTIPLKSCDAANAYALQCSNGARRDILMVTNSINASINGRSGSGVQAETYNVVASGTSIGVGTLTANSTFTATKQ